MVKLVRNVCNLLCFIVLNIFWIRLIMCVSYFMNLFLLKGEVLWFMFFLICLISLFLIWMILFVWFVILFLWVMIIIVSFLFLCSFFRIFIIFMDVLLFRVLVGLLVRMICGLDIKVCVMVICCFCLLDNLLGIWCVYFLRFSLLRYFNVIWFFFFWFIFW